jgi:hypothetical protein
MSSPGGPVRSQHAATYGSLTRDNRNALLDAVDACLKLSAPSSATRELAAIVNRLHAGDEALSAFQIDTFLTIVSAASASFASQTRQSGPAMVPGAAGSD